MKYKSEMEICNYNKKLRNEKKKKLIFKGRN